MQPTLNWVKGLFTSNPNVVYVTDIKDLFPYFDPDKFFIGVRKGAMSPVEHNNFMLDRPFKFNGDVNDFVILPKQHVKKEREISNDESPSGCTLTNCLNINGFRRGDPIKTQIKEQ